jgi:hypothetical protein
MNEWISNEGNKDGCFPKGCTDENRKVRVKLRDGTEEDGGVWRFWWVDCGVPSDIVSYQYIDEEEVLPQKYYSDWLSNEGNVNSDAPNVYSNKDAVVDVVYKNGETRRAKVEDHCWDDYNGQYAISEYRYVYDEPPETFDPEPQPQDTDTTLKVLEVKEEPNGDVVVQLQLNPEALKVLIEQGLRAIIKNTAEAELQRIKDSTPKKE